VALHFARLGFKTPYGENQEKYTQELVESIPMALQQLSRIKAETTAVLCSSAELYYKGNDNLIFPLSGIVQSLQQSSVKYPLLLTPYNQNIGKKSVSELVRYNINPVKSIHLDIKKKEELFNYSTNHLINRIELELTPKMDGICVLCTNFATMHLAKQIESKFNIPFISSNFAVINKIIKSH
jgi:maleate cis-trans isomerase